MRGLRSLVAALCAVLVLSGVPAYAAPAVIQSTELHTLELENGTLFSDGERLMPGDKVSSTLLLRNEAVYDMEFLLRAQQASSDNYEDEDAQQLALELLEELQLEIVRREVDAGGNIGGVSELLYTGPASGDGNALAAGYVSMAQCAPGGWAVLQVTLEVPTSLTNKYMNALGAVDWLFLCRYDDSGGGTNPGGGGGGGTGSGSGNGRSNLDNGVNVISILDGETPLGTVTIVDEDVPLGSLPKTGGLGAVLDALEENRSFVLLAAAGLCLVVGCGILFFRVRRRAR